MKVYVVYCHPDPGSFTAALRELAVSTLQAAGHEVHVTDLYADDFEPAMSAQEVNDHLGPPEGKVAVAAYCENLTWCEALVFIYPTWWSGQPAMLKGWLDRVLIRGVAWDLPSGATRVTGRLTNVRRLIIITTHGSSKLINLLEGETGRRLISRTVRMLCHRMARTTWLAMYGIDTSSAAERQAYVDRVTRRLASL